MFVEDILTCALPSWLEKFEDLTIPTIVIPLSDGELKYFQEDGTVVIPDEHQEISNPQNELTEEFDTAKVSQDLSELGKSIKGAIKNLGGSVFPKMNWSSPKDAAWISYNNSLRCFNSTDVYLLMKSSTFVAHDLTCPFKDCEDDNRFDEKFEYSLILRKWQEINPSNEFRCFVKNKSLVGISQRDISQFCPSIHSSKSRIKTEIYDFWWENIDNNFPLDSYVFDIHRPAANEIILVDFGPFGRTTDSLLFSWKFLEDLGTTNESDQIVLSPTSETNEETEEDVDFRYIENDTGIQPNDMTQYSLPVDVVDSSRGVDMLKLKDLLQMKTQNDDCSTDEE